MPVDTSAPKLSALKYHEAERKSERGETGDSRSSRKAERPCHRLEGKRRGNPIRRTGTRGRETRRERGILLIPNRINPKTCLGGIHGEKTTGKCCNVSATLRRKAKLKAPGHPSPPSSPVRSTGRSRSSWSPISNVLFPPLSLALEERHLPGRTGAENFP